MSTSKQINKLCLAAVAVTLALTILFLFGGSLGLPAAARTVKYESTLFDTSYVHQIDIVMNDWEGFLETCENEEYATCTVVVDGKKHANIAIRAKGNTSLSSVKSMGSQRYSFKLEFDHYESGKSLDGLDKLCLNNLIQDNIMMKDYVVYTMMREFGADAPLCSFAYLTVNGEDWGLYLAVEGVEDSFLARNYGADPGELYKPDSMSFGGGRGNGKDFNIEDFRVDSEEEGQSETEPGGSDSGEAGSGGEGGDFPGGFSGERPGNDPGGFSGEQPGNGPGGFSGEQPGNGPGGFSGEQPGNGPGGFGGFSFGGMGGDDVKLQYIDDDPDSYSNIFDSAKTDVTAADQERLIASLKQLNAYTELEEVLDLEEVLRYFVVHIFVCNGDSYTGSMVHNYYLHEEDGKLGMIPWDYNLAFGTFQGGDASGTVNSDIDSPVSNGSVDDRPMVGWIFSDEIYTEQYHALFAEFLAEWFDSGKLETLISDTADLLRPYVEKDPTKFCTAEEFEQGVEALTQFVTLRGEAVGRQLAGDETAVDTTGLNLSDMGTMGGGNGGGFPGGGDSGEGGFPGGFTPPDGTDSGENSSGGEGGFTPPTGSDSGENSSGGEGGFTPPTGSDSGESSSGGEGGAPANTEPTWSDGAAEGSQSDPTQSQQESGSGGGRDGRQPPSGGNGQFPSGDGQQPPSGGDGQFPSGDGQQPPSGGDGQFPGGNGQFPSGGGQQPPSGGDGQFPGGFDPAGSAEGTGGATGAWLLVAASALVLAAGIWIAVKKRY